MSGDLTHLDEQGRARRGRRGEWRLWNGDRIGRRHRIDDPVPRIAIPAGRLDVESRTVAEIPVRVRADKQIRETLRFDVEVEWMHGC